VTAEAGESASCRGTEREPCRVCVGQCARGPRGVPISHLRCVVSPRACPSLSPSISLSLSLSLPPSLCLSQSFTHSLTHSLTHSRVPCQSHALSLSLSLSLSLFLPVVPFLFLFPSSSSPSCRAISLSRTLSLHSWPVYPTLDANGVARSLVGRALDRAEREVARSCAHVLRFRL